LLGIAVLREADGTVVNLVMRPEIPVGDLVVELIGEDVGTESFPPRLVQADKVGDAVVGIEVGNDEIVEYFDMGAGRVGEVHILDERGLLQDVPVGLPLVQTTVDDGEGDAVAMADEDQGRHDERLVDRAGDARQEGAGIEVGRQFRSEEEIGVDASAIHGGHVVQQFPLHGQFGIGELKQEMERCQLVERLPLARRENVVLVPLAAEVGDGGNRESASGPVTQRSEETGGRFGERVRLEVLESGSDLLVGVGQESVLPIKLPITITYYPIRRHFACFPRPRHSTDFSNAMSFNTFRIMSRLTSGHLLCSSFT
jgi:hypothetical protein